VFLPTPREARCSVDHLILTTEQLGGGSQPLSFLAGNEVYMVLASDADDHLRPPIRVQRRIARADRLECRERLAIGGRPLSRLIGLDEHRLGSAGPQGCTVGCGRPGPAEAQGGGPVEESRVCLPE